VANISIRREHGLPHVKAVEAANRIAVQLQKEYGVLSRWQGSTLHFERAGLTGTLELSGSKLKLEIHLGFLMSVFRERISEAVEQTLRKEFAPKSAKVPRTKPART
jgi:putative polyhydroxyalkanoate system protein